MPWNSYSAYVGKGQARRAWGLSFAEDMATNHQHHVALGPLMAELAARVRRPDEPKAEMVRRLIADDLWRCPEGDLSDRGLLLFLGGRDRVQRGCGYLQMWMTEGMDLLVRERTTILHLTKRDYLRALLSRADVLLAHGIHIPDDPERAERAIVQGDGQVASGGVV